MKSRTRIRELLDAVNVLLIRAYFARINKLSNNDFDIEQCSEAEKTLSHYSEILKYILSDKNTEFDELIDLATEGKANGK